MQAQILSEIDDLKLQVMELTKAVINLTKMQKQKTREYRAYDDGYDNRYEDQVREGVMQIDSVMNVNREGFDVAQKQVKDMYKKQQDALKNGKMYGSGMFSGYDYND